MGRTAETLIPLRASLFPQVPPYVLFSSKDDGDFRDGGMDWHIKRNGLLWQHVYDCVQRSGFTLSEITLHDWEGTIRHGAVWENTPISELNNDVNSEVIQFGKLSPMVKINRLPGMYQLGRKDNLYLNYQRMLKRWGPEIWGNFHPVTFVLPRQVRELRRAMREKGSFWIVKPPNMWCGLGIKVISDNKDVPAASGLMCVQRYIKEPLLINNLKFDLRLYLLITSVEPLRMYLCEEGLTRFATDEYTNDPSQLNNNFIHLTNFSLNKESDKFIPNSNPEEAEGSKWTLTSLWKHLDSMGIKKEPIWNKVQDILIKTVISTHSNLLQEFQEQVNSHYTCYKILGCDIFIDSDLQPHLIEVNTVASLNSEPNTVDSHVKHPMVAEMFNIAGFHISQRCDPEGNSLDGSHDRRLYSKERDEEDLAKEADFASTDREEYKSTLCATLTPQDVRLLVHAEDELSQTKMFTRIWPTRETHKYFKFMETVPYAEKLMDAFEYQYSGQKEARLLLLRNYCDSGTHLKLPLRLQLLESQV